MGAREVFEAARSALRERDAELAALAEEERWAGSRSGSGSVRRAGAGDPTSAAFSRIEAQRARCEEASLRADALVARAEALLDVLSDAEQARVFRSRYLRGCTPRAVAAAMGCSRRRVFYLAERAFAWLDSSAPPE